MRILWPCDDIRIAAPAAIMNVALSEVTRRAERLGILNQRTRRKTVRVSMTRLREVWADKSIVGLEAKGAALNMSKRTAQKIAKDAGLPNLPQGRFFIPMPKDFDALWLAGVYTKDIAVLAKCSTSRIAAEVRTRNLQRRKSGERGKISLVEYRLLQAMTRDARTTQLAFEATGRQTITHWAELRRIAA